MPRATSRRAASAARSQGTSAWCGSLERLAFLASFLHRGEQCVGAGPRAPLRATGPAHTGQSGTGLEPRALMKSQHFSPLDVRGQAIEKTQIDMATRRPVGHEGDDVPPQLGRDL